MKLAMAFLAGLAVSGVAHSAVAVEDAGMLVATVCSQCHTPANKPLDKLRLTRAQWAEAVERMIIYGAPIPRDKVPALLDYLLRTHDSR